jgi:hypothetical protein
MTTYDDTTMTVELLTEWLSIHDATLYARRTSRGKRVITVRRAGKPDVKAFGDTWELALSDAIEIVGVSK